jgi:predicted small lipoprotein YifL
MNRKIVLLLLLLLSLVGCFGFKEDNPLAIPPFAREELSQE